MTFKVFERMIKSEL